MRKGGDKDLIGGLEFIDILVDRMKRTSNKEWFRQQARFINSGLRTANQNIELYKKVTSSLDG